MNPLEQQLLQIFKCFKQEIPFPCSFPNCSRRPVCEGLDFIFRAGKKAGLEESGAAVQPEPAPCPDCEGSGERLELYDSDKTCLCCEGTGRAPSKSADDDNSSKTVANVGKQFLEEQLQHDRVVQSQLPNCPECGSKLVKDELNNTLLCSNCGTTVKPLLMVGDNKFISS